MLPQGCARAATFNSAKEVLCTIFFHAKDFARPHHTSSSFLQRGFLNFLFDVVSSPCSFHVYFIKRFKFSSACMCSVFNIILYPESRRSFILDSLRSFRVVLSGSGVFNSALLSVGRQEG